MPVEPDHNFRIGCRIVYLLRHKRSTCPIRCLIVFVQIDIESANTHIIEAVTADVSFFVVLSCMNLCIVNVVDGNALLSEDLLFKILVMNNF